MLNNLQINMNEIFLDTETTGLSPHDKHKIVEVACIETKDLNPTKKIFHKIINPQRDVPEGAFKIHGFATEFLKDKETFNNIADDFLEFIKDKKIIIHNASFDLGFLNYELKLIRKNEIKKTNVIDSLEVARAKFPGSSNSLDALCRRFGIDLSKRTKHNALLDCELLREVYINLLDAKEPKLIFTNENLDINKENLKNINKNYCKKVVVLTPEEAKLHSDFLKKEMKKNYY
jgi:DNA polymerase-3 subunit epsilon